MYSSCTPVLIAFNSKKNIHRKCLNKKIFIMSNRRSSVVQRVCEIHVAWLLTTILCDYARISFVVWIPSVFLYLIALYLPSHNSTEKSQWRYVSWPKLSLLPQILRTVCARRCKLYIDTCMVHAHIRSPIRVVDWRRSMNYSLIDLNRMSFLLKHWQKTMTDTVLEADGNLPGMLYMNNEILIANSYST